MIFLIGKIVLVIMVGRGGVIGDDYYYNDDDDDICNDGGNSLYGQFVEGKEWMEVTRRKGKLMC